MATKITYFMEEKRETPWFTVETETTQKVYFRGTHYTVSRKLTHYVHPLMSVRNFTDRTISVSYMSRRWYGWTQTRYQRVTVPTSKESPKASNHV